ncbi:MAG: PQQ-binding-like beta-propeller repeat protein [Candidatus Marinimicrobia bacterium]|nr:PQQ-binding-like beta-propeller repeat protein [Candidatus Neomarinimicrobiota bacterium]
MILGMILTAILVSVTNLTITEPVDGETYDGDWLTIRAIVENENELPDSVHYTLNLEPVIQIPRLSTDWPTYMQNYQNHGYSESPAPNSPDVLWTAPVCGDSHEFCSPVIVDGIVYFLSDELSTAFALDAASGEVLWTYDVVDDVDDAVTYHEGDIYISADSAWCLNAQTGNKVWSFGAPAGCHMSGSPLVENGIAYFVSTAPFDSLTLHAFDAQTGQENWNLGLPSFFESCLALHENTLFLASHTAYSSGTQLESLFAVDALTGNILWTNDHTDGGYWDSSPTIRNDTIYIGGDDGYLHAFNADDGTLIWESKLHEYSHVWGAEPTPALHGDRVFMGCSFYGWPYGFIGTFSTQTGAEIWGIENQMQLHGSIGLAEDLVFMGEHRGDSVYAFNQNTGAIVWSYGIPGGLEAGFQSSPSITDGVMYIAATDSNLYAFGTGLKFTYLDDLFAIVGANELIATSYYEGVAMAADTIYFTVTGTGIELDPSPLFNLNASPNPFHSTASISFELAEAGWAIVSVYDLSGRIVRTLENSELGVGQHSVAWDGSGENGESLASGVYFCRIQSGGISETTGLCLLK